MAAVLKLGMGLRWYILHLQGHKIPLGSRDFSDKFRGRQPKKFENPWLMGNLVILLFGTWQP
jgi:hypothetical protein